MTPNGEVDKKRLPEVQTVPREYIGPRNEIEERLVIIWKDILSLVQIGVTDDFFELGGHSVTAMRLLNKMQREFDVNIRLDSILKRPTIEEIGREIARQQWIADSKEEYMADSVADSFIL